MAPEAFRDLLRKWRPHLRQKEKAAILGVELDTFRGWIQGQHTPTQFVRECVQKLFEAYDKDHA